ncbi:MAG: Flagellar protein FlgJ [peptidoglycan hydrolase] [Candidatus Rifleibacterium amylolyticum]|nr:MAG: Flagellar protein FlgJ [peptidoglycan hydrolase] [Candidatus Rifleibacterium amylolyticum]NLF96572.1 glycoside hydrolase family 73 protein [Candidatus Riflebacteria bacterium]
MKKCKMLSLILMMCASFFMTGCDAQQILNVIQNVANGVQQAMPAIRDAVGAFQNAFNNNNTAANNNQNAANNNAAETNATNQANVNVTNPNQEDIAGQNNANTNTANNNTQTNNTTNTTNTNASQAEAALANYKGGKLAPSEFAKLFGPVAREASKKSGVPASIIMAQAALETGWGGSAIGDAKNLFGIKGTGPAGSITMPTKEFINGRMVTVQGKFRKYNSWQESIEDHSKLLTGASRYAKCMAVRNDPDQFARELQKAGYATDPQYANKLISIMKSNNFYQYNN